MVALRLVPLAAEHLEVVQPWLSDPLVLAFTPVPEPVPPRHAERWLSLRSWGAYDGDELVAVGMAPVVDLDRGEVELGYVVAPSARGRGVATALLGELTDWALGEGAQRVVLRISPDNVASSRAAQKVGYLLEGTLRSTLLKPGVRVDTQVWSLLPTDPRPCQDRS